MLMLSMDVNKDTKKKHTAKRKLIIFVDAFSAHLPISTFFLLH